MKVLSLSEVKMKFSEFIEEVSSRDEEITVTRNGKPVAVIVSAEEFDSWEESIAIRSDDEFMAEIRKGIGELKKKSKLYTLEELFTD